MPKRRYYGWRGPGVPDARDYHYAAPQGVLNSLPRQVNLDVPSPGSPFDPPFDQGSIGSCGPNSLAGMLAFGQLKKSGAAVMPSRLFLYYTTRSLMGTISSDSGVDNRTMLKAVAQYGWCDESSCPYNVSQFKTKPPAACFTQAAGRKITQYQAVPQTLDQMRGCLAQGYPFLFGFAVYESFESDAVDASGDVPMPNTSREELLGGHDIVFTGYDDDTQMFNFRNSWGDWGNKGYGRIPYGYATNARLANDFWMITDPGWTPNPPPPPTPPSPPAPPSNGLRIVLPQPLLAGTYTLNPATGLIVPS